MNSQVKENSKVSPFFIFFLIHGSQTGVGILNFQSEIVNGAEQDSWVSILLVGLSINIIIWMIYFIFEKSSSVDIISLHHKLIGKFFGNIMNSILYVYLICSVSSVICSYIEVLHVWVFPNISGWQLSLLIILMIFYIVFGGFRIVTGISFFGVVIPSILLLTIFFPLKNAQWTNLLPVFNHNHLDFFNSAQSSIFMYLGAEFLLIYFPFIKNSKKSQKWAHLSNVYTTFLYLVVTITTFVFFSMDQLKHAIWPTLIMSKIIQFPFIERFEYIFIFVWLLVILPPSCVALWSSIRIIKKCTKIKPKYTLILSSIMIFVIVNTFNSQDEIDILTEYISNFGTGLIYIYIPFLFIWVCLRHHFSKEKRYTMK